MSMLASDWLSRLISPADCGVWTHPHFYTDLRPSVNTVRRIATSVLCRPLALVHVTSRVPNFTKVSVTRYLWPRVGPPLTTTRHVVYFRFCGLRHRYHLSTSDSENPCWLHTGRRSP